MSTERIVVVEPKNSSPGDESKRMSFRLEWAENGALWIKYAGGEYNGRVFHWVGDEDDFRVFVDREMNCRIVSETGALPKRPVDGGMYIPGFGYIPPGPCDNLSLTPFSEFDGI